MNYFTFSWGNNYIAVRGLLRSLGHGLADPPRITPAVAERGIELAHPFLCFSGKLVLGQIASQLERGDRRMAFMSSVGPEACRCADTSDYMEALFAGYPGFSAHMLGGGNLGTALENLRAHFGSGVKRRDCVKAYAAFLGKVDLLHKVEKRCTTLRCLSSAPAQVRELEQETLKRVDRAQNPLTLWRESRRFERVAASLPVRREPPSLRIGVVGGEHILSELDSIMAMIHALAERGILLEWRSGFRRLVRASPSSMEPFKRKCRPYLHEAPSTSEIFSCADALDFVDERFDGLLHIYAFGCMPQSSIKPVLQRIARDAGTPLLSLAIGDRFAEEGLENRLEAFVDLLDARKSKGVCRG